MQETSGTPSRERDVPYAIQRMSAAVKSLEDSTSQILARTTVAVRAVPQTGAEEIKEPDARCELALAIVTMAKTVEREAVKLKDRASELEL